MALIRGDLTRLFWKTESTFGEESTGSWRRFGITHTGSCPDPDYQYQPTWIAGEGRDWKFMPGRSKEIFTGSLEDVWLQDGRLFKFMLGSVSTSGGSPNYTHTITTATTLPSFTWEVNDRPSDESWCLVRRYLGCKINRCVLEAKEGANLSLHLESIEAKDMKHSDSQTSYKYEGGMSPTTSPSPLSTQPYMFHEGELRLFGITFAYVKSFRLLISNNLIPEYSIQNRNNDPVPLDILEGKTLFKCTAIINIAESVDLWRAMMKRNVYDGAFKGFNGYIEFRRGQSSSDTIKIKLGPTTPSVTNPGCFIKKAPMKIVDSPLIPITVDIEVPVVSIEVKDSLSAADYA